MTSELKLREQKKIKEGENKNSTMINDWKYCIVQMPL